MKRITILRTYLKKRIRVQGKEGLQRLKSGVYMSYVSTFCCCVTQTWALRIF